MSDLRTPRITRQPEHRRLIIEKDFDAALPRVWAAWTTADRLARWWGPRDWPAASHGFDFREGGHWHFCLSGPGGEKHWGLLRFLRIDPLKELQAEDYETDETAVHTVSRRMSRWEVRFRKVSSQVTRVVTTLICDSEARLDELVRRGFEAGFCSALENLTESLTGRSTPQTVVSKDGTKLVYEKLGSGSPVILVGGALVTRDNPAHTKLAAALSARHTVFNYDRRGRGDSGDLAPYAVERELEDLQALLGAAGGSAAVYALSSGAMLALHGAAQGLAITKLMVWEPPFVVEAGDRHPPAGAHETAARFIAEDRPAAAVTFFMTQVFGMPAFVPWLMRLSPYWKPLLAVARTIPYDLAIAGDFSLPAAFSSVRTPTLVLHGDHTQPLLIHGAQALARTLPAAKLQALPGGNHQVAVANLAPVVLAYLAEGTYS